VILSDVHQQAYSARLHTNPKRQRGPLQSPLARPTAGTTKWSGQGLDLMKMGTGSELADASTAQNSGSEVPVPLFQQAAKPSKPETSPLLRPDFDPAIKLSEEADGWYLEIALDKTWAAAQTRKLVTTELLGKAVISIRFHTLSQIDFRRRGFRLLYNCSFPTKPSSLP
jgi:hypothetical protein